MLYFVVCLTGMDWLVSTMGMNLALIDISLSRVIYRSVLKMAEEQF